MGKRILLADDSVTIQKVVELTFMEEDYEVIAVSNGDDALVELDKELPDLVIADVHMPGANGYELCRQTKEAAPGLPVLLLVGTFEPFDEAEAQGAGADGHLKKPFDSQELLRRVEELLAAAEAAPAAEEEVEEADEEVDDEFVEAVPMDDFEAAEDDELDETMAEPEDDFEDDFEAVGDHPDLDEDEAGAIEAEADELAGEPLEEAEVEEAEVEEAEVEPEPVDEPVAAAEPEPAVAASDANGLSAEDVDRIARRVVELMGDQVLREVAWDVVPDLAELVIKDRIRELEQQLE